LKQSGIAIIINSPSYDRVSYGLSIAAVSAAHSKQVHVLFTYGAICRLLKGKTDQVDEETDAWIRNDVKSGLKSRHMPKISEMIVHLKEFGGKIYACSAAITFHHINKEDLIEEVDETIGISAFLEKTEGSRMLYV